MGGEFDRHQDRVNNPAEDNLSGGPAAVALQEFLDGRRFVAVGIVARFEAAKDFVQCVEEDSSLRSQLGRVSLAYPNEVIDKHVEGF
jgi:hypothetical protein